MQVVPAFPRRQRNCTVKLDAMGTVAARLGWAFDRLLIYGKGGAAWTNDSWQVLFGTAPPFSLLVQLPTS